MFTIQKSLAALVATAALALGLSACGSEPATITPQSELVKPTPGAPATPQDHDRAWGPAHAR